MSSPRGMGSIPYIEVVDEHTLLAGDRRIRCAIGPMGISDRTTEGSRTTPRGEYALRPGFFRSDRVSLPRTDYTVTLLSHDAGWCDDPASPDYNQYVKRPYAYSHEELWRSDHTYDFILPIGYNDDPVVPGKGSAIFFHIAQPDYRPTLGCVAIALDDMLQLLPGLTLNTRMRIGLK